MAGAVVDYVLGKLADAAIQEVLFLYKVNDKAEAMRRELKRIKCFLMDADMKHKGDNRVQNWVREIRDVAFKIEDVFDTFLTDIGSHDPPSPIHEKPRKRDFIKRMLKKSAEIPALHKYGIELDKITKLIDEIWKSRDKYGIKNLGEGSSIVKYPVRRFVIPDIDRTEVVGFEADRELITEQLLDQNISRRSVVSIVGQGGLGKTTLAVKVYKSLEVSKYFDIKIWVTISNEFELNELLRKIIKQTGSSSKPLDKLDEEGLITELFKCLENKKYLIAMDDVWTSDLWKRINVALPDDNNNSRVLITSRFINVAKTADPVSSPYELSLLNNTESLNLLLKKAIPANQECPMDLLDLAKMFSKKCGGLPLALVVLGGLLSIKPLTYTGWNKVPVNWHNEGKECTEIIVSSYEDLPYVLKSCFMYFAIFPEDYRIEAKSLIRMWVAEGFIPEEDDRTMEDTAECYLEELVQRSMIQVSKRDYDDSIKYCHIHDLLHDLAIQKAKDDNFFAVFSNPESHTNADTVRRAVIHHSNTAELMQCLNPYIRSLVCYNNSQDCSNFKLLRVYVQEGGSYDIHGCPTTPHGHLVGLTNLRYLKHRDHFWSQRSNFKIDHIKNLQTIDLTDSMCVDTVHDSIWNIKALRHIILPSWNCKNWPPASADMRNLQTLINVGVDESWRGGLPNMPNLRELIVRVNPDLLDILNNLVSTLTNLVRFQLRLDYGSRKMLEIGAFPSCMQFLYLDGYHDSPLTFDANLFPINLVSLTFANFKIQQDIIPILEKLTNLKELTLSRLWFHFNISLVSTCSAGGFCQLRTFELEHIHNMELKIEEGAFPVLKQLTVEQCTSLRPVGLQHVTTLQTFSWRWQWDNVDGEESVRNQIKHIPSVVFGKH